MLHTVSQRVQNEINLQLLKRLIAHQLTLFLAYLPSPSYLTSLLCFQELLPDCLPAPKSLLTACFRGSQTNTVPLYKLEKDTPSSRLIHSMLGRVQARF